MSARAMPSRLIQHEHGSAMLHGCLHPSQVHGGHSPQWLGVGASRLRDAPQPRQGRSLIGGSGHKGRDARVVVAEPSVLGERAEKLAGQALASAWSRFVVRAFAPRNVLTSVTTCVHTCLMPRYDSSGKNRSAMVHASRGHQCSFCDKVSFGNGGQVSHGRKHVRAGEAVELVKHYGGYPPMTSRFFVAVDDTERIAKWESEGFSRVED